MNEQIREKYLPVGTVVLLKNGTKRVMINGFCTMDASNPNRVFDYSGVLFPEGSLSSDQTLLFDHDQIVRIDHIGLEDDEEKSFKIKLKEIVASSLAGQNGTGSAPQPMSSPTPNPMPAQPIQNPMPTMNPMANPNPMRGFNTMGATPMDSNTSSSANANPFQGTNY